MNTVRTHMRLVLEKTGTHRQAELVSLLLRSVVTLQRPETQP
jgi:DNA-binding CsgD family transcriptional regulator